jgi:Na+/H+ antiporter NhaD/arsenite permease-like protein
MPAAIAIFVIALAAIASERIDRTKVALLGAIVARALDRLRRREVPVMSPATFVSAARREVTGIVTRADFFRAPSERFRELSQ